jgi:iron(II)-dependent oxidoreductase
VLDLAGNVREWVSSLYKPYPYSAIDGREDLTASTWRVIRGGSWVTSLSMNLRSADRDGLVPSTRSNVVGFRCGQEVD